MTEDIASQVRPYYSELQGYLSQARTIKGAGQDSIYTKTVWEQMNSVVELLNTIIPNAYDRFYIQPMKDSMLGNFVPLELYRQKLGGLISKLHAEYFSNEPPPFAGMPSVVISQSQEQSQSVQMFLDFQSKIDENLPKFDEGSKEKKFLQALKDKLGSAKNINQIFGTALKLASDFDVNIAKLMEMFPPIT